MTSDQQPVTNNVSSPAIKVEGLSKRYHIGARQNSKTFREAVVDLAAGPFRRMRRFGRSSHRDDDSIWALKDVSFEVQRGEVLGIIGRNGAGKSTLLKVLSKITEPTEGRGVINGRVASLLEVGTGFHPELTGWENIYLSGAILGMTKAEIRRKFDEIVDFSGVEKFIDTPVKRYSSGMHVRLGFAVAAHLEPDILLVDEVLAVGDAAFRKKCFGKVSEVARGGRTVLLVSHNLASIANLCARAILLEAGRVVMDGQPAAVVQHYLSGGGSAGGEVRWPDPAQAPGDDLVRLHAVRILQDGSDGPTEEVGISKEVRIEITYWCLQEGPLLYPAVQLYDHMGTLVLGTSNGHSMSLTHDAWYGRPYPRGLFQSVCHIPGNFLNDGRYTVGVVLGKEPRTTLLLHDNAVSFDVHDTGEMRKTFFRGWGGVVRPRLAWHTERLR